MKELVAVYLQNLTVVACKSCEGLDFEVVKFYREKNAPSPVEATFKYLDCCAEKVGNVVEWEDGE